MAYEAEGSWGVACAFGTLQEASLRKKKGKSNNSFTKTRQNRVATAVRQRWWWLHSGPCTGGTWSRMLAWASLVASLPGRWGQRGFRAPCAAWPRLSTEISATTKTNRKKRCLRGSSIPTWAHAFGAVFGGNGSHPKTKMSHKRLGLDACTA